MVISDFIGRLGNNLFQLAASVGYATKYNVNYEVPPWEYSDCFNINAKPCIGDVKVHYGEKEFCYGEIPFMEDVKLFGYFQSEKYFKHCEEKVRDLFQFSDKIKEPITAKYQAKIKSLSTCSIHIRRGDYIGNFVHEVCHLEYYNNAINEIKRKANVDLFLVFSDGIPWCKENLKGENYLFIEGNSNVEDLFLMTQCSHNIICNSSFSWWGAWLNANKDKIVIAPSKWFGDESRDTKDLLPDSWIKVNINNPNK